MAFKILIATDGSKFSEMAADYGIDLAGKLGCEVVAIYVVSQKHLEWFALGHHDDIGGYEKANENLMTEGDRALYYVETKSAEQSVKVSRIMPRGYPADEILKAAKAENVGLIVVGNLGKTGLEHLLMGSVSEAVAKKAPCPVLVVRNGHDGLLS
jgi:nucleotide-binding universal stress UspA family protein